MSIIPERIVSRFFTVMSFPTSYSGKYFSSLSSTLSLPCSRSIIIEVAQNCLETEPMYIEESMVRSLLLLSLPLTY